MYRPFVIIAIVFSILYAIFFTDLFFKRSHFIIKEGNFLLQDEYGFNFETPSPISVTYPKIELTLDDKIEDSPSLVFAMASEDVLVALGTQTDDVIEIPSSAGNVLLVHVKENTESEEYTHVLTVVVTEEGDDNVHVFPFDITLKIGSNVQVSFYNKFPEVKIDGESASRRNSDVSTNIFGTGEETTLFISQLNDFKYVRTEGVSEAFVYESGEKILHLRKPIFFGML